MRKYQAIERLAIMRMNRSIRQLDQWREERRIRVINLFQGIKMAVRVSGMVLALILGCSAIGHAQTVVQVAESQIGKGEIGGDNRGPIVKQYTNGKEVAWCSGFVSWVRTQAGLKGHYHLRAKSWWDEYPNNHVKSPKPGDLIIFKRGKTSGHVGIVESVQGEKITTIEGNVGSYPARVKRITYTFGKIHNLIGFVHIP